MNSDNRSSHLLGCIIGFTVAMILILWFFYGCDCRDDWIWGQCGQEQAQQKVIEEGAEGYNIIGSPSD